MAAKPASQIFRDFTAFDIARHVARFRQSLKPRLPERPAGRLHESVDPPPLLLLLRALSNAEKPGPLFRTMRYGAATFRSV